MPKRTKEVEMQQPLVKKSNLEVRLLFLSTHSTYIRIYLSTNQVCSFSPKLPWNWTATVITM